MAPLRDRRGPGRHWPRELGRAGLTCGMVSSVVPSMDGRTFVGVRNSSSGEVSGDTVFRYRERDGTVWAEYVGGSVLRGYLVGTRSGDDLDFRYVHLSVAGATASGHCTARLETLADGRIRSHEMWQWESREGAGSSVVEERPPPST